MTIRATLAAEFWHGATGRGLAEGFRALGWLVDEIDVNRSVPQSRRLPSRALGRLFHREHVAAYNRAIVDSITRHRSDVFVTCKGSFITAATLAWLGRRGVRRVNYYPDVEFDHQGKDSSRLSGYDLVATTKSYHMDMLRRAIGETRAAFVHHGYSPAVHRPVDPPAGDDDYDHDIAYVGNASPYKRDWLLGVRAAFPDARMIVAGFFWEPLARGTPLETALVGHGLSGDFYARLASRSRINLAIHSGPVRTPGWEDRVSTRSFEIPACGGFMLHVDNPEIRALFEVGREISVFATADELAQRIDQYLGNPEDRRAMAARAHARAVPAYSLTERARTIASLLSA